MKLRKLFAGLAAAATLLGGLALGTVPANAADALKYPDVDENGVIQKTATFKFISESADQWGPNNNRVIKAYKIADYVQYLDSDDPSSALYGVQTPSNGVETIKETFDSLGLKDGNTEVVVPENTDPMAWILQKGYLDRSVLQPWTYTDESVENNQIDSSKPLVESTSRKFADALVKYTPSTATSPFETFTLTMAPNKSDISTRLLTKVDDTVYTADLPAGIYLFLDETEPITGSQDSSDKNWEQNGTVNDDTTKGQVIVNSAPILIASGHLTVDGSKENPVNVLDPFGNPKADAFGQYGDNTVAFKNHVTPITKSVDDADKSVSTGQVVRYTLKSTLPLTTGYDVNSYVFSLTDYPGAGQTVYLDGGVKDGAGNEATNGTAMDVKIYNVDEDGKKTGDAIKTLTAYDAGKKTGDYILTTSDKAADKGIVGANKDENGNYTAFFKLDFSPLIKSAEYNQTPLWGKLVEVTYAAKITSTESDVPNTVEVNDNNAKANHGTKLTLGKFQFIKTDAQGKNNADINGASFQIEADPNTPNNTAVTPTATPSNDENHDHLNDPYTGEGYDVSDSRPVRIQDDGTGDSFLTQDGVVTFSGLADGVYIVWETKAPQGFLGDNFYVKFKVTIKDGHAVTFEGIDQWGLAPSLGDWHEGSSIVHPAPVNPNGTEYKVKNVRNVTQLPLTGGAGIVLFGVIGAVLAGGAVLMFVRSRKTKMALMMA
ncbi:LPXTG cell wall anchor domain-containing protein [Bifidobacterium sp. 82T10]|uniref:LPXTG cell wall anchor domain-containing protein n=1 Tax=Bifidobacterium miconis TaxID=2834435 RepID=A0ABS6WCH4_9BIFI|nr:SpaA isopeptide-forming pilin-related protein [Bifidobacterium miconis]MBW3091754.1 LPXTG cell wall anchor domain-containing protein [Bifidobacterium miconis]